MLLVPNRFIDFFFDDHEEARMPKFDDRVSVSQLFIFPPNYIEPKVLRREAIRGI